MLHPCHKIISAAAVTLLAFVVPVSAAQGRRSHFLNYGPGVAAAAMGDTFTAAGNDMSVLYYNPSLLATLAQEEFVASYWHLYDGARYSFLGFSLAGEEHSFALSGMQLYRGNIEARTLIDDTPQSIDNSQIAVYGAYAGRLQRFKLNYGATIKYLHYTMHEVSGSGAALDIGLSRRLIAKGKSAGKRFFLDGGLAVQNAAQLPVKLVAEDEQLPLTVRLGLASNFTLFPAYSKKKDALLYDEMTVAVDLNHTDTVLNCSAGLQYALFGMFYPRIGWNNGLTAGFGFDFPPMRIDYAHAIKDIAGLHKIAFTFRFGEPVSAQQSASPSFTEEFQKVYQKATRIFDRYFRDAGILAEQGRYDEAISLLHKALPLKPRENAEAKQLLATCENAVRASKTNEHVTQARQHQTKGARTETVTSCLAALDVSADNNVKLLLESILNDPQYRSVFEQQKSEYVVRLTKSIDTQLETNDFGAAESGVRKLALIDPDSTVHKDYVRRIQDRKELYTYRFIKNAMEALKENRHNDAYFAFLAAEQLSPKDTSIQDQKHIARKKYLAERKFSVEDKVYADKLYYLAAVSFATDETSLSTYRELLSFNAVHDHIPELEQALIWKNLIERRVP